MKKTITLAALVLGLTTAAFADSITATTKEGNTNSGFVNGNNERLGYVIDMSSAVTYTLDGASITDFSAYNSVTLDSISMSFNLGNTSTESTVRIAVYTISSTSDPSFTKYCGVSSAVDLTGTGTNVTVDKTFTFKTPINFDPSASYAFVFVTDDASASTLSAATSFSSLSNVDAPVSFYHSWSGLAGSELHENGSTWKSGELPLATYKITANSTTGSVPEPATATLSLLALAGLAARRRRK